MAKVPVGRSKGVVTSRSLQGNPSLCTGDSPVTGSVSVMPTVWTIQMLSALQTFCVRCRQQKPLAPELALGSKPSPVDRSTMRQRTLTAPPLPWQPAERGERGDRGEQREEAQTHLPRR